MLAEDTKPRARRETEFKGQGAQIRAPRAEDADDGGSPKAIEGGAQPIRGPPAGLLDDYWSTQELAAELGVHTRTIRRYTKEANGLPFILIGGRMYHPRSTTREWLAERVQFPNPTRS